MNEPLKTSGTVQSLDRMFSIIEKMSLYPAGVMLTELSDLTDLHKSTVFRLLGSLIKNGYAIKDETAGKYRLTLKMYEIGLRTFGRTNITDVIHTYLRELASETGECVHFAYRDGAEIVYMDKEDPSTNYFRISTKIGFRNLAFMTSLGKSMLCFLPRSELLELWNKSNIVKRTEHTITDFPTAYQELQKIRAQGYAVDNEEWEAGLACVGVPIENFEGYPKYAISISVPSNRLNMSFIQSILPALTASSKKISRFMGNTNN